MILILYFRRDVEHLLNGPGTQVALRHMLQVVGGALIFLFTLGWGIRFATDSFLHTFGVERFENRVLVQWPLLHNSDRRFIGLVGIFRLVTFHLHGKLIGVWLLMNWFHYIDCRYGVFDRLVELIFLRCSNHRCLLRLEHTLNGRLLLDDRIADSCSLLQLFQRLKLDGWQLLALNFWLLHTGLEDFIIILLAVLRLLRFLKKLVMMHWSFINLNGGSMDLLLLFFIDISNCFFLWRLIWPERRCIIWHSGGMIVHRDRSRFALGTRYLVVFVRHSLDRWLHITVRLMLCNLDWILDTLTDYHSWVLTSLINFDDDFWWDIQGHDDGGLLCLIEIIIASHDGLAHGVGEFRSALF